MQRNYIKGNCIEIRLLNGGKSLIISGFIPTNKLSHAMYSKDKASFFRESIRSQAFSNAINKKKPKLLLDHDDNKRLEIINFKWFETKSGLKFEAEVNSEKLLIEAIDKNCVNGLSFGFIIGEQSWSIINNEWIREVISFKELMEISILTGKNSPAYPDTTDFVADSKKAIISKKVQQLKQFINEIHLTEMKRELDRLKSRCR
ncbi:HK97 family phage prohead protease [Clostridium butyricum]